MILVFVTILSGIVGLVSLRKNKVVQQLASDATPTGLVKGSSTLRGSDTAYPSQASDNLGDFLVEMLDINIFSTPNNQFEDCLSEGIREFFGFSPSGGSFATTSMKIMTESGRLNVILRELIRNGVDLGESAEAAFTGTGSASPIAGVLSFLKSLAGLKIINFINVLVGIGDKILENSDHDRTSTIDKIDVDQLDDAFLIGKSRLSDNKSLAWSTTTAHYYSLDLASIGSSLNTKADLSLEITDQPNYIHGIPTNSGRISAEDVKVIEDSLESDYMPFYFHDLRTNEIMSFHAFLENASEDFSVEYTSQEGYGRMDKVQIYKGTTRNITVDFKMIATNPDSHDDMWYKINRLAMMIYPQWTQGRKLDVGNLKFIQPFSQIPGATPVIRLRLGDLYRSNYSKMAVARLFGASTREDYTVTGNITAQASNAVVAQPTPVAAAPAPAPAPTPPRPRPRRPGAATPGVGGSGALDDALLTEEGGPGLIQIENLREGYSANEGTYTGGRTPDTPRVQGRRGHRGRRAKRNLNNIFIPNDTLVFDVSTHDLRQLLSNKYIRAGGVSETVTGTGTNPFNQNNRLVNFYAGSLIYAKYISCDSHKVTVKIENIRVVSGGLGIVYDLTKSNPTRSGRTATPTVPNTLEIPLESFNKAGFLNYNLTFEALNRRLTTTVPAPAGAGAAPASSTVDPNVMNPSIFYGPNNPILKAFNSTAGKGLAGVITSFKVDYKESDKRWGIDATNKLRAPMYVTISVTMAVIHDIPLGLDSNGIMNAPIWPVGNRSNYFMRNGSTRETRLTADEI